MNTYKHLVLLLCCWAGVFLPAYAQSVVATDSSNYRQVTRTVLAHYQKQTGAQNLLYRGKAFTPFRIKADGHQFFESEEWVKGTIRYEGLAYHEVEMRYDVMDAVVLVKYGQIAPIKLESEKVSAFSIHDHRFIRLVEDSSAALIPRTDFYDVLYTGERADLLAVRKKYFREVLEDQDILRWFEDVTQFYIRRQGNYYPVKNKRSVLNVFSDRKRDVKRFIKKNQFKFRRQTEEAIAKTVEYYDQLPDAL